MRELGSREVGEEIWMMLLSIDLAFSHHFNEWFFMYVSVYNVS